MPSKNLPRDGGPEGGTGSKHLPTFDGSDQDVEGHGTGSKHLPTFDGGPEGGTGSKHLPTFDGSDDDVEGHKK